MGGLESPSLPFTVGAKSTGTVTVNSYKAERDSSVLENAGRETEWIEHICISH